MWVRRTKVWRALRLTSEVMSQASTASHSWETTSVSESHRPEVKAHLSHSSCVALCKVLYLSEPPHQSLIPVSRPVFTPTLPVPYTPRSPSPSSHPSTHPPKGPPLNSSQHTQPGTEPGTRGHALFNARTFQRGLRNNETPQLPNMQNKQLLPSPRLCS